MCTCDAVEPAAYREVRRRSRLERHCADCHYGIAQGETYVYASGIWDGSPSSFKLCLFCHALRSVIGKAQSPDFGVAARPLRPEQELADEIGCAPIGDLYACIREATRFAGDEYAPLLDALTRPAPAAACERSW